MEEDKIRIRDAGRFRNTLANKLRSRWHRHKNSSQRLEQETPQILIIGSSKSPPTPTPIPPSPSPDLLPVELWVVIFQHICRDTLREHLDRDDFYDNSSRLHLTPITLSHVCRSWNQVILSHPLFWANLFVYVGARFSEPLLEMCHSRRWKTVSFNLCDSAVQLWQTIFMTIESDGGEEIVRTWRPLELPELEEVEVMMLGYTYVGKEIDFVSEVCSNSRLHSIKIRGPNKPNDIQFRSTKPYQPSASIISSLSNLSLRNIRMPSAEILITDLSKAAHVQFLEIRDPLCIRDQLHADTSATPRRTELDHITRLSVVSHSVHNAFWVSLFFQSISLPSLEDLTAFLPGDPNSVHGMIEASQCNIRKLTIKTNARGIEEEMAFLSTGTRSFAGETP
ncbi:hypothetical protein BJ165DRAFT_1596589 [Panaeolus papilionaceus]|nr:hypothetical protein BJ165DRAFT_1596589 [Panaeolus papilionaceus]